MHYLSTLFFVVLCAVTLGARAAAPPAQKFVVFFQEWSAALDDPAQAVISDAAQWAASHPDTLVRVGGFADPVGSRKANILLSELRAQVVVDRLEADGVNATLIRQHGRGSVQFALTSQESRRVEISFGKP